jgi:hypothetical protein
MHFLLLKCGKFTRAQLAHQIFWRIFLSFQEKPFVNFQNLRVKIPHKIKNINLDKFNDIKIAELFRKSLKPILVFKN